MSNHRIVCTGCGACSEICPQRCICMEMTDEGFPNPVRKAERCTECHLCDLICPLNSSAEIEQEVRAYAANIIQEKTRKESSSGGIFSALAKTVLGKGGMVVGAAFGDGWRVKHICIEKASELYKLRGAKYAQSDMTGIYKKIKTQLSQGRLVLFSGLPCQAAGLKAFLRQENSNLIIVDCVCHGVPSPQVWETYLQYRAQKDAGGVFPEYINLRDKTTGWSRYRYSVTFRYPGGMVYHAPAGDDLYMKLFVGDYINRESCGDCQFKGAHRATDLTLGDFWGIWDILPEMDDDKGTSLVLVHSEKGRKLLEEVSGSIRMQPVTLEQATAQNPAVLVSARPKPERSQVLKLCLDGRFEEVGRFLRKKEQKKRSFWANLPGRIWRKLRSF